MSLGMSIKKHIDSLKEESVESEKVLTPTPQVH